jgi:hypothetical protein
MCQLDAKIYIIIHLSNQKTGHWKNNQKLFCIPESFNTNISHQLFDYTITFVNTNSNGDFVLKNQF